MAIKAAEKIADVAMIQEPTTPIKRPKKKQEQKLKKGNKIIHKYIKKTKIKQIIENDESYKTIMKLSYTFGQWQYAKKVQKTIQN